jgi:serine/threonine protein kinase
MTRSLLHRDVKRSNIGRAFDGVPKFLDLGFAKLIPRVSTARCSIHWR